MAAESIPLPTFPTPCARFVRKVDMNQTNAVATASNKTSFCMLPPFDCKKVYLIALKRIDLRKMSLYRN